MKATFYATVAPGLTPVAGEDWRAAAVIVKPLGRVRNYDFVQLESEQWPQSRLAEDVFVSLGRLELTGRVSDMKMVAGAAWWGGALRRALEEWSRVTGKPVVKRLTWRVVVQADDVAWRQYRRQELTLAAERGLLNAGASWRINRDEAPLEMWLWQVGRELVGGLRLTTNADRQHGGREMERAAALRPSIAAAMVWLSRPEPTDVFLDPMCGTGTLLLERAAAGRYELLLGGDSDEAAVAAALANFGPRHQPRRIECWDAQRLPLADSGVTRVVTNLPWGRQVGEKAAMPELYRELLTEFERVLAPGGRMVLLTSEWQALKAGLAGVTALRLERTINDVEILGRRADIFVINKAQT